MTITPIYKIQGRLPQSPLHNQQVVTQGVVTGWGRRGFFIQEVDQNHYQRPEARDCSQAIFVYYRGKMPPQGTLLRLSAKVVDYVRSPEQNDKPVTQLHFEDVELLDREVPLPPPVELSWDLLVRHRHDLGDFLNAHESMLFSVEPGAEFLQASNSFGDYVVLPQDAVAGSVSVSDYVPSATRGRWGGLVVAADDMDLWLPSFRTHKINDAPIVNVGDKLTDSIVGPLYYRSGAYQLVTSSPIEVERQSCFPASSVRRKESAVLSVMTMNYAYCLLSCS